MHMTPAQMKAMAKQALTDKGAMEDLVLNGPSDLDGMEPEAFAKRVMDEDGYAESLLGQEGSAYARRRTAETPKQVTERAATKAIVSRLELAGLSRSDAMAAAADIVAQGLITDGSAEPPEGETVLEDGSERQAGA